MPRILLVDDDDALRKMLRLTLTSLGHVVVEARDGKEALVQQQREPVDVLLTDLIMPEKEGLETIREFRQKHPAVRVVAMSGGGRVSATDHLKLARSLGAGAVLAKPFSNSELTAAIALVTEKA